MSEAKKITGGCLCGSVRFELTAAPHLAYYCHCSMCRRWSGTPATAAATVSAEHFSFTGFEPVAYRSSDSLERLFCGKCGSPIVCRSPGATKYIDFSLGSLDDPEAIIPGFHQHVSSQVGWYELADELPRHESSAPELGSLWSD